MPSPTTTINYRPPRSAFLPQQAKRQWTNWALASLLSLLSAIVNMGCSHWGASGHFSPTAPEAVQVAAYLKQAPHTPTTIKGIGTLKLTTQNVPLSFRIAWIGQAPSCLRVETISLPGQPAVKIAGNGEHFALNYWVNGRQDFVHYRSKDPSLEHFLSIDIRISELVTLLCGRLPMRPYGKASLSTAPQGNGYLLTLDRTFFGTTQKIYLDATKRRASRIEYYNFWGHIDYIVELKWPPSNNGFEIPSTLMLSNAEGVHADLYIQRYWPNIDIAPELFELSPADS